MNGVQLAGVLVVGAGMIVISLYLSQPIPELPPRWCQTIPAEVAAWGLSVQSTPSGLYFCYQQGAGQGTIEVVCTPMKDCKP